MKTLKTLIILVIIIIFNKFVSAQIADGSFENGIAGQPPPTPPWTSTPTGGVKIVVGGAAEGTKYCKLGPGAFDANREITLRLTFNCGPSGSNCRIAFHYRWNPDPGSGEVFEVSRPPAMGFLFPPLTDQQGTNGSWKWVQYNDGNCNENHTILIKIKRPGAGGAIFSSADVDYFNSVCSDNPLPVELTSFSSLVNKNDVTLNWGTSAEVNNSEFEIERSIVNGQWSMVGFVNGHGTVTSPTNYSYEDRNLSSGRYNYRLKQIDYNGNFEYYDLQNDVVIGTPTKFALYQNYPNPFNPSTKINYDIAKDGIVKLTIYDNTGRVIQTLVNEFRTAGYYTAEFDASNLPSGVYLYKLESNNIVATKKMLLLK